MNASPRLSSRATAEVMVQILRYTSSMSFAEGLNPAQWAALRYFSQAVPSARTVTAFARYHGTTKGTASQTIAALTRKGLLDRKRDEKDGRSVQFQLTDKGEQFLAEDPLHQLSASIQSLDVGHQMALAEALEAIMRNMMVPPTE